MKRFFEFYLRLLKQNASTAIPGILLGSFIGPIIAGKASADEIFSSFCMGAFVILILLAIVSALVLAIKKWED